MTITREQVADLQPGDVVEYSGHPDLKGARLIGPVHAETNSLFVADYVLRRSDGSISDYAARHDGITFTVISRARRPLYVNSDRTEPVPGDVVRDADSDDSDDVRTWCTDGAVGTWPWLLLDGRGEWFQRDDLPARLRLLVDGTTGQVVP